VLDIAAAHALHARLSPPSLVRPFARQRGGVLLEHPVLDRVVEDADEDVERAQVGAAGEALFLVGLLRLQPDGEFVHGLLADLLEADAAKVLADEGQRLPVVELRDRIAVERNVMRPPVPARVLGEEQAAQERLSLRRARLLARERSSACALGLLPAVVRPACVSRLGTRRAEAKLEPPPPWPSMRM
jgi:hypothetical protein